MKRPFWKQPYVGITAPWIIMVLAVLFFHRVVSPFGHARSVLLVTYHEMQRNYRQAAVEMAKWDAKKGIDSWRNDLFRSAGMSMLLSGDFDQAIDWFNCLMTTEDVAGKSDHDYFALIYRGICYHKIGKYDQAYQDWALAFQSIPERHDAFIVMGHSCLLEENLIGAYSLYRRALDLGGQLGPVYADIGDAWRYIDHMSLAADYYRRGLQEDPTDVFCRLRQGELALIIDNNPAAALHECALIRNIMPNLRIVEQLETAAHNWVPGKQLDHIPAARFISGPAQTWKISPSRLYFEFFREDWHGW